MYYSASFAVLTTNRGLSMVLKKEVTSDYWIVQGSRTYAGEHMLIDLYGADNLDCTEKMEQVFKEAVKAANATMLHLHMHNFGTGAGVSGVAVLSESHISVHTWPERNYAAFDIFMCGQAEPNLALTVIKLAFPHKEIKVTRHLRGEKEYENIQ